MKLAVFGSTGGTGRQIVAQALDAGHEVTAFARHPTALEARRGLRIVAGHTDDRAAVVQAVAGCDAVLCALGGHPLRRRERVCSTAMQNIAAAMRQCKVLRVIAISTFGAGETRPGRLVRANGAVRIHLAKRGGRQGSHGGAAVCEPARLDRRPDRPAERRSGTGCLASVG